MNIQLIKATISDAEAMQKMQIESVKVHDHVIKPVFTGA